MRWPDGDASFDDEVAGALLALDATLDGEPVDPEYAELAELALILRDERPAPDPGFADRLDERVQRRFARPADARGAGSRRWLGVRRWWLGSGAAVALGACVAVVVALSAGNGVGPSAGYGTASPTTSAPSMASSSSAAAGVAAPGVASGSASAGRRLAQEIGAPKSAAVGASNAVHNGAATPAAPRSPGAQSQSLATGSAPAGPAPAPSPGRQIVQSAQLQLSTAPSRIDDVAQQVFDVVGAEDGIVDSSNVTSTGNPSANAFFKLRIPSQNLTATLGALSRLRGADVVSRTDSTQDITGEVGGAGQRLAEARALRRSLLRQLAVATTTAQVDSLKVQLRDADAAIASDLSTLNGLKRQVAYSLVAVTIQAVTPPPVHRGGSFTIGRAAHDAKRVLVVVAGVALIALAVLVPVAVVGALLAWIGLALRRRRREHALDLV